MELIKVSSVRLGHLCSTEVNASLNDILNHHYDVSESDMREKVECGFEIEVNWMAIGDK